MSKSASKRNGRRRKLHAAPAHAYRHPDWFYALPTTAIFSAPFVIGAILYLL